MCVPISIAVLASLISAPVRAGQWQFTVTGSGTESAQPSSAQYPPWAAPAPAGSVSTSYGANVAAGVSPSQSVTISTKSNSNFSVAVAWVPNGTLAADPQPPVLRVTETGSPTSSASGTLSNTADGSSTPVAGASSATLTGWTPGTTQYTMPGGFASHSIVYKSSASVTVTTSASQYGGGNANASFTYSASVVPITAGIVVDQDQQIFPPAATTRFSATISNASGFTIDSVKISVDGTSATATVNPSNPNNYYIDWPQSGGNPSEHTVTATAQIHDSVGALSLNSTDPPNRQYNTSGMGRPADDIIADVHLQSIKFNSNIALNQDFVTPVPSPEIVLIGTTSSYPAAYIQGKSVNLTLKLSSSAGKDLTGSATMGYLCKLQANPNTVNPATKAADPVLTLYDNTTASPTVPASCTASTTIAATTALDSWVAPYTASFPVLAFYVEFTKIPTPTWSVLSSYYSTISDTIYATVAAPTAPMAAPWVGVLTDACNWAERTTSATSATTALTTGEYNNCTYNGGNFAHTPNSLQDGTETFHLQGMLGDLTGQCNDFSDFLVCLSNAIGARPIKSQRSVSAAEDSAGSHFYTNPITAAPQQTSAKAAPFPGGWSYHQWTNDTTLFDGCLRFGGTTAPADITGPAFGSTYNTDLVASYLHLFTPPAMPTADWDPQTPLSLNVVN